ncbi:hypothetical protein HWD99_02140 [Microbacterium sp. C5A9]|uniref:hypothetical protein n=1 Tax=Microbacterium sp. C5A9 TaxID=2736663 RepID=UPI001F518DE1|nr:hypothetical protein [Microbacterium sp. C5A9]MCI1017416.1 hypothetical protein [Microbacterium sp. C5A9]
MSDQKSTPDGVEGIDAVGVDADFVTNDPAPAPDEATPGEEQTSESPDEDSVDVADLP